MSLRIHILLQQTLIFIPQWRNRWRTLTAGSKRQIEQTLPRSHKCQFTGRSVGVRNGLNVLYSLVADNTDLCFYRVHVALLYCRTPLHWRLLAAGLCAYDAYRNWQFAIATNAVPGRSDIDDARSPSPCSRR